MALGRWHWGDAKLDGAAVIVSSTEVEAPVAVRYAWASNPAGANLVNSEGLPVSVFRSDDWNDVEIEADRSATKAVTERRALALEILALEIQALEIQALNARRVKLDRKSPEFQALNKKRLELLAKFRALSATATATATAAANGNQ